MNSGATYTPVVLAFATNLSKTDWFDMYLGLRHTAATIFKNTSRGEIDTALAERLWAMLREEEAAGAEQWEGVGLV